MATEVEKADASKTDISTIALLVAVGVAIGGVLLVPISKLFLPPVFQTSLEVNGQFGDFVGGLLNPVIALLAFTWLRKGVIAQQTELEATKKALEISAKAQAEQVQISAVTAMLQVELFKINLATKNLEAMKAEIAKAYADYDQQPVDVKLTELSQSKESPFMVRAKRIRAQYQEEEKRLMGLSDLQEFYSQKLKELAPMFSANVEDKGK